MPEFINTGRGMRLVETNNASAVPFEQGNLIIQDDGKMFYDSTIASSITGRVQLGKADEIVDLGTVDANPNTSNNVFEVCTVPGIYKYKFNNTTGVCSELLVVAIDESENSTIYQYRITATNGILHRSFVINGSVGPWQAYAGIEDIPEVINELTSDSTTDALSAAQGKALKTQLDLTSTALSTHAAVNATTSARGHVQLVNNLTTNDATMALTAAQGRILNQSIGTLSNLDTTVKSNLVEAINEAVSNSIVDLGSVGNSLLDSEVFETITTAGVYKFSVVGGSNGILIVEEGASAGTNYTQYLFQGSCIYQRTSSSSAAWSAWESYLKESDIIDNLTSTATDKPLSAYQGKALHDAKANKATTAAGYGITDVYTKTEVDSKLSTVYEYKGTVAVSQLPSNLGESNIGDVYNLSDGGILNSSTENEVVVIAGDNVAWTGTFWDKLAGTIVLPPVKEYAAVVIGNAASGVTEDEVDFLYTDGQDFSTTLQNAVNALPSTGGEIKILSGTYEMLTSVSLTGTYTRKIKITGSGKSTVLDGDTTNHNLTVCYCEFSNMNLAANVTVTTTGYVSVHDCNLSRVTINNSTTVNDIFIYNNKLNSEPIFMQLSGASDVEGLYVYNNQCDVPAAFDFVSVTSNKYITRFVFMNNFCPYGSWNSSTATLTGAAYEQDHNVLSGNVLNSINFGGTYFTISDNTFRGYALIRSGSRIDFTHNRVNAYFACGSDTTYCNMVNNVIGQASTSPFINIGDGSRFVGNVIESTSMSMSYVPGYDSTNTRFGNNLWSNGFDQIIFASGEAIGNN